MTHYKKLLDPGVILGPQDFPADKTLTISRVVREKLPAREGEEQKERPLMYFMAGDAEYPRPFALPKSVLYGLSVELGPDIDAWVGKQVTLFATKCMSFGEVEECVRVRFTADTDTKIRKWMKKRKSSPAAYMIKEG